MSRKLVWIRWNDASFYNRDLHAKDVDEYDALTIVETAGLLIKETKDFILLAVDLMPNYDKWRNITAIPKVNVIKKKVLKVDT